MHRQQNEGTTIECTLDIMPEQSLRPALRLLTALWCYAWWYGTVFQRREHLTKRQFWGFTFAFVSLSTLPYFFGGD